MIKSRKSSRSAQLLGFLQIDFMCMSVCLIACMYASHECLVQGGQSGLNLLELELKISYHIDSGNSTVIQVSIIEPSLQPHYFSFIFSVLKVFMVEALNFLC